MPAQVEVLGYGYGYGLRRIRRPKRQNKRDDINATAGDEGQIVGEGSRGRDTAIIPAAQESGHHRAARRCRERSSVLQLAQ
jgi:hypothetical protein